MCSVSFLILYIALHLACMRTKLCRSCLHHRRGRAGLLWRAVWCVRLWFLLLSCCR